MMEKLEVEGVIKSIAAKAIRIGPEAVQMDAALRTDLGLDSLELLELTIAVEEALEVSFEQDRLEDIQTLRQMVDLAVAKLPAHVG